MSAVNSVARPTLRWLVPVLLIVAAFAVSFGVKQVNKMMVAPVPAEGLVKATHHRGVHFRAVPLDERPVPEASRAQEEIEITPNVAGTFTFVLQTDVQDPVCAAGISPYELPEVTGMWKTGLKLGRISGSMGSMTGFGSLRMPDCVRMTVTRLEDGAVQTQDFHFDEFQ